MQNSHWMTLLRRIPVEEHAKLSLVTASGTEITINTILMYEGDFLGFKGRLSGSQDTGRLFFIPYAHIDYIGFTRAVTEEEFRTYFGEGGALLHADMTGTAPVQAATPITAPAQTRAMPTMVVPPVQPGIPLTTEQMQSMPTILLEPTPGGRMSNPNTRTPIANRAALLESIRARGLTPRPTSPAGGSGS